MGEPSKTNNPISLSSDHSPESAGPDTSGAPSHPSGFTLQSNHNTSSIAGVQSNNNTADAASSRGLPHRLQQPSQQPLGESLTRADNDRRSGTIAFSSRTCTNRGTAFFSTKNDGDSKNPYPNEHPEKIRQHDFSTVNIVADAESTSLPPPAPPPASIEENGLESTSVGSNEKPSLKQRLQAGCKRFYMHTKNAIFHSWINVLLIFVPVGIAVNWAPLAGTEKATIVFALNAIAIIPLAGLLSHATESVASRMGDTWASLLNVTFGNAVELIIFVIALAKNQIPIVQASILGSILANLLLILGMAFLFGGLLYREQIYNSTVTQMSACLLSLSVMSLLLPTAFHASFSNADTANARTIKISRGTSVVLLLVYVLYLVFQLKSHAYMYESTPQKVIDEESHPGVLTNMLHSSSSSECGDSTDSDDSDSSGSSHNTARKRLKRAFRKARRRRSSLSSTQGSLPSTMLHSPVFEERSEDDVHQRAPGSYFPQARISPEFQSNTSTVMSGDGVKLDQDFENHATSTQDFGAIIPPNHAVANGIHPSPPGHYKASERSNSSVIHKLRRKKRKHRHHRSHRFGRAGHKDASKKSFADPVEKEIDASTIASTINTNNGLHVEFADHVETEDGIYPTQDGADSLTSPRRHFTRQLSRPMGNLPISNIFSRTVFSMPRPVPNGSFQPGLFPMARTASLHPTLRRTNSLPDRLPQTFQIPVDETQPGRLPVINAPDATEMDQAQNRSTGAMSRTAAVVLLLCTTGLVAFCAELLVDAIPTMVDNTSVSQAFIGLIILPIVGNAAEHVTAVTVATKNKMDLAIGVAVGSSIQIALFVTPVVVILGWILDKEMSLYFNLFETVSLFVTAFVVNFLVLDGRSNYLEGSLLIAAYVIIALAAFFYPNQADESLVGGGTDAHAPSTMLQMFR